MSSILTNRAAMQALAVLRSVSNDAAATQRHVATGLRVGSAHDNAAFWAVSMAIRSETSTMRVVADGLSVAGAQLAVARGASEKVVELMSRVRASSASLEPGVPTDKAIFGREIEALLDEVDDLLGQGGFNGANLLDGAERQVAIGDGSQLMTIGGQRLNSAALGLDDLRTALSEAVAYAEAAASNPSGGTAGGGAAAAAPPAAGGRVTDIHSGLAAGGGTVLADGAGVDAPSDTPVQNPVTTGAVDDEMMLVYGTKWGGALGTGVTLTYSFREDGVSSYDAAYDGGAPTDNPYDLNAVVQDAVLRALDAWSSVANISFVHQADTATTAADLRFGGSHAPSTAYAFLPSSSPEAGDVWFGADYETLAAGQMDAGTYYYMTAMHEIGHALGLKHPHEANGFGLNDYSNQPHDSLQWSLMSYNDYVDDDHDALSHPMWTDHPTTPMVADIAAIQYLYGANTAANGGDTTYSWDTGARIFQTIWDGGGVDRIDWSNQSTAAVIDLRAGQYSQLGPEHSWGFAGVDPDGSSPYTLGIAAGAVIEQAYGGSANDRLVGNAYDNLFAGNRGNDTIDGGAGTDTAVFSGSRGSYEIEYLNDGSIRVSGADGTDTLTGIEKLQFDDGTVEVGGVYADRLRVLAEEAIEVATTTAAAFGTQEAALEVQKDIVLGQIMQKTLALGVLVDADMNVESARMQALNVQVQLATESLAIANRMPQGILELFRAA